MKNYENYYFKKLTEDEQWSERESSWAKENLNHYIRLLIINDKISLINKLDKEKKINWNENEGILLTLAVEKKSINVINFLEKEKGLELQERDIQSIITTTYVDDTESLEVTKEILDKFNFNNNNFYNIITNLENIDYYNESVEFILEYLFEKEMKLDNILFEKLSEQKNLDLILKKFKSLEYNNHLFEKFPKKQISSNKNNKI